MPVRVFISYSHKDTSFQRKLDVHLAALKREGAVSTFFDGDIHPGQDLDTAIKRELRNAEVFVALASPDYLHSTYCFEKEYQYALRRAGRKSMHVVAAVIRPCQWKHTKMGHYKALPEDGQEVTTWGNRDSTFEDIVNGVRQVVRLAEASQREHSPPPARKRATSKAATAKAGAVKEVKPALPPKAKKAVRKTATKAMTKQRARPGGEKAATRTTSNLRKPARRSTSPR